MPIFTTHDGTALAYHVRGRGEPLVCLPGGAMRASQYLGELGGLTAGRTLFLLDLRGTGDSAVPADESTYRVDHQVADVEALRRHLGLERMDLLAHSAGANLALLYAAAHPERLRRLALVTPTAWAVGLAATAEQRLEAARLRAGTDSGDTDWDLAAPLFYGRWDAAARANYAAGEQQQNEKAALAYAAPEAFDPPATRAALARVPAEVLVLAGELDGNPPPALAEQIAALFSKGRAEVQPAAGHFPWMDDAARFAGRVEHWLSTGC